MNDRPVERCVCHDVPFAELLRIRRETGDSLDDLIARTRATTGCGLCYWYVRAALATGETRFPVLSDQALRQIAGNDKGPAS